MKIKIEPRLLEKFFGFKKNIAALFALWIVAATAFAEDTNRIQTLPELQQNISNFLAQPRFDGALWGVKIVSLDTGKTLFESHADRLMSPASNCKMFTGALALDKFGGDYKISTPVYATAKPNRSGTIRGDLIIVGHGDPTWNPRRFGTNFWDIFEPFVSALKNAGVRRVTGDLIADATYFHGEPTGGSLMIDDFQNGECPYISALQINDGWAQARVTPGANVGAPCRITMLQPDANLIFSNLAVTVSSKGVHHIEYYMPFGEKIIYVIGQLPLGDDGERLDIPDLEPTKWFGLALKDALARNGIEISGKVRGISWPQNSVAAGILPAVKLGFQPGGKNVENSEMTKKPDANPGGRMPPPTAGKMPAATVKIAEILSPPLRDVVKLYMKPSENLENDTVLADVGEATRNSETPSWRTSEELGLAAIHQFLATNNLPADEVHFDEGSGLSDDNMATANSFVALLQFMWRSPASQDFINALPIAAVDGTLRRRFHDTPAAENLRAKTGSLWWTRSLSGYVASAAGEHLAFSLLLNRYAPPPHYDGRAELDAVALMLANFSGRSIDSTETLEKKFAPFGDLIFAHLANAPFPDPARANGHWYHNQFFSAPEHYSDNSVAIFIPKNFRATNKIDFVVHFHGWSGTLAGVLESYKLIEQFAASGKNAILVVPQGPFNAPDSFGGKLEDTNGFKNFMDEIVSTLKTSGAIGQNNFDVGNIIISGHSGGYHVMAAILDHGGLSEKIREAWLFDALYDCTTNFVAWQKNENGRLLDIYTDHGGTEGETTNLMSTLKANGLNFFFSEDTNATPENLRTNKFVFLHSNLSHGEVIAKRKTFEQFLETSCLGDK